MSFKINNGVGEGKRLTTSAFPSVGTGVNLTVFGWMYGPTGTYKHLCELWSDDGGGSRLDRTLNPYVESNQVVHGTSKPYSQATMDATTSGSGANAWPNNSWKSIIMTATLSGAVTIQIGGGDEYTASTLHSAWFTAADNFVIGGAQTGGSDASQDIYIAHVCVWDVVVGSSNRALLLAGANPLAIEASDILEYWTGESLTGYNGTVLSWTGGTGSVGDANNPTVDDPPGGGGAEAALSGSALTGGHGTQAPSHSIPL